MGHFMDIVNEDTIRESMSNFQSKKTPGPDGFKPVLLLHLPPNVLGVLCVIYRSCLYLRYTPCFWKKCHVIFLPKPARRRTPTPPPIALFPSPITF